MLFSQFGFLGWGGHGIGVELSVTFVCALSFGWCLFVVCMIIISCATTTAVVFGLSVIALDTAFLGGLCAFFGGR